MKLAIAEINAAAGMLSGIKLSRIEDKEAKAILLKDYLALRKVVKDAEARSEEHTSELQSRI